MPRGTGALAQFTFNGEERNAALLLSPICNAGCSSSAGMHALENAVLACSTQAVWIGQIQSRTVAVWVLQPDLLRALSSLDMPELYPSMPASSTKAPMPMAMFRLARVLTANEERDTRSASSIVWCQLADGRLRAERPQNLPKAAQDATSEFRPRSAIETLRCVKTAHLECARLVRSHTQ